MPCSAQADADRRRHLPDAAREGRRGLRADRSRVPGRRPGQHPRAHPARHRGDGRRRRRHPRHRRAVAGDRASPGPAGDRRWSWCSTPTRSAPAFLWEALLAQGAHDNVDEQVLLVAGQQVWSALDVQNAVFIDAYRRESVRLHRRDLQRQQSTLDALVEGRGADPDVRRRGARGARHRRRDDSGLRRGAVRRVAGRAADAAGRPAGAGTGSSRTGTCAAGVYFGLLAGDLPEVDELVDAAPAPCDRPGRDRHVARRRGRVRDRVPAGRPGRRHGAAGGAPGGRGHAAAARGAARPAARRSPPCSCRRRSRRSWPSRRMSPTR